MKLSKEVRKAAFEDHTKYSTPYSRWADKIAELEEALGKYMGAEANEYGQSQKRIAELEAERKDAEARFQKCFTRCGELNTEKNQLLILCNELNAEKNQLRDALDYAMDYMDSDQQHRLRTELWPELFNQ